MAKLTLYSTGRLTANKADRTLTGLLLPYNEEGRTNLGRVTVPPGVLHAAAEHLPFYDGHGGALVGSYTHEDTPEGIRLVAAIFPTPEGDQLLTSGKECVSVEVDPITVRAGRALAGVMVGAAAVEEGAFPSARLAAEGDPVVPDMGDHPERASTSATATVTLDGTPLPSAAVTITTDTTNTTRQEGPTMTASVHTPELQGGNTPAPTDSARLFATLVDVHNQALPASRMEAALSDIIPANILGVEQPQYVGEMWRGQPYERKYIPVFNHADLNSFTIKGWQFKTRPAVDLYSGNKTDIPSGTVETEETSGVLQRIAGGHDIDRKFRDFSNTDFWEAYFRAMAESYAKVSDTYVRDQVKALPTAGNGQRVHLLTGNAPSGVPTAVWQIVKGCIKMLDDLDTLPTFAYVTSDYWEPLFYVQQQQVLAYLNMSLGLKEGTLEGNGFRIVPVPAGSLTVGAWVGKTLVGHKEAVTVYELPGSPIRVEAEAISKGGIDEALFGYVGYQLENAKGLISFDAPAAS